MHANDPPNSLLALGAAEPVPVGVRTETRAATAGPAPGEDQQPVLRPGDLVDGTYRIKRLLGQGGMGQVWEAVDELLCRPVALKTAWPRVGSTCLIQEGQALAALRHPVVPGVFGMVHHGPALALVMERLSGRTLERLLEEREQRREMLSLDEALRILGSLAAGLEVIHTAGISHRDLKPANIMLAPQGRVVLLDFGVFVPECAASPPEPIGTPYYIAPEAILEQVATGQAFLTDLYSFGVVAFEVLTLRTPYFGRTIVDLLNQHVYGEIPRLRGLRPDAPPALETLLLELMAKSPADRPPGATAVIAQLQRIRRACAEASTPGSGGPREPREMSGPISRRVTP
jgi:serine/threonine-protein kinase